MEGEKASLRLPPRSERFNLGIAVYILVSLVSVFGSYVIYSRFGVQTLAVFLVGLIVAVVYTFVSFRSLVVPMIIWILAVGGFRFLFAVQAPFLPDLYLDRMLMIWMTVVFMIKVSARGQKIKRPLVVEALLLTHGLYLLLSLYMHGMVHFHTWTMSILVPYGAYFFAKNTIDDYQKVRKLLFALLLLGVYYYVTSIAEQYQINWLIWPRWIIGKEWFIGRSSGPFKNPGFFGNVIGMLLPIHLYFILTTRRVAYRVLLYISFALSAAGLFFTYTRGSWMAGVVSLLAVAYFGRRHYLRFLLPSLFLLPLAALFVLGGSEDEYLRKRVSNQDNIDSRVGTAVTVLRVWRDHPFIGCGAFRYREVMGDYIEPIHVPGLGTIRFQQFRHNSIHDMYWGPLAEDGLVGTALQMAIFIAIFRIFRRKIKWARRGDPFAVYVLPIFAGIFANYLVGGLTISYRHVSTLGTMFYMAAGIMDGYRPPREERDELAPTEAGKL